MSTWVYELPTETERKASAEEEALYKKSHLTPDDRPNSRSVKLSPDGKTIAYVSQFTTAAEFAYYGFALYTKELGGGKSIQRTPSSLWFISDLWWSKDGSQIYMTQSTGDGRRALFVIPAGGGEIREVTKSGDRLEAFSFDRNMTKAVCIRQNPTLLPELALVDLQNGVRHTLISINPEFQNIILSPATRLKWTNKHSDQMWAHLLKPLNYEAGKRYLITM